MFTQVRNRSAFSGTTKLEAPEVCKQRSEENTEEMSKLLTRNASRFGANSSRKLVLVFSGKLLIVKQSLKRLKRIPDRQSAIC